MGWINSPPFFWVVSETGADLINIYLADSEAMYTEYFLRCGA